MIVHKTHFSAVTLLEGPILGVEEAVTVVGEAECNRLDYSILEIHKAKLTGGPWPGGGGGCSISSCGGF